MNLEELGRSGIRIPEVGIGTFNHRAGIGPLRRAMEAGALFLDTAESYGTEEVVGEAIRGRREQVFLATKVSPKNFRRAELRRAVDGSLSRLQVETIDLLQLHYPNAQVPIEETMQAMAELVDEGKVRFLGVSNFSVKQLEEAQRALPGEQRIVSNQVRYNLIDRTIEKNLLEYCQNQAVTVIAYSPLAKGLSRIMDCDPEGVIKKVAESTGKSPAQVVLNWCLVKGGVVVIPSANSEQHAVENAGASGWRLTAEELIQLDTKIQFRYRTWFDALVRKLTPPSLVRIAVGTLKRLPQPLRRSLS